jgi:hypothetical protein
MSPFSHDDRENPLKTTITETRYPRMQNNSTISKRHQIPRVILFLLYLQKQCHIGFLISVEKTEEAKESSGYILMIAEYSTMVRRKKDQL